MSRRLRRLPALILPLVLATTLAACGDDEGGSDGGSSGALQGVTVSGELGETPEVEWDGELEVEEMETSVVIEGEGEELAEGDQVSAYLWIGNGTTQEESYNGFEGEPETITASKDLSPVFRDAVLGQQVGSRVAVTTTADEAFGESGNPSLGIGNKDSVLILVDLMERYTPPEPTDVPRAQMPKVVEKGGDVTGLDFRGIEEPEADGDLLRTVLTEGDGRVVEATDTVTADYLGMTYDAKKPFDESYSKEPVPFSLQGVISGWTYGLSGLKVGSRVLLQIPSDLGYGAQGSGKSIPPDSTLWFVVDIVDAEPAG